MKNELYDIAIRNSDRYEALARRAEASRDDELAHFFRVMRDENRRRAKAARRLLAQRIAE